MSDSNQNFINKIINSTDNGDKSYTIGSFFDNIFYSTTEKLTLMDFFTTVKDFFSQPMHMIYHQSEPKNYNIKEWYKIENS